MNEAGNILRNARSQKGIPRASLASICAMKEEELRRIEMGEYFPDISVFLRISSHIENMEQRIPGGVYKIDCIARSQSSVRSMMS